MTDYMVSRINDGEGIAEYWTGEEHFWTKDMNKAKMLSYPEAAAATDDLAQPDMLLTVTQYEEIAEDDTRKLELLAHMSNVDMADMVIDLEAERVQLQAQLAAMAKEQNDCDKEQCEVCKVVVSVRETLVLAENQSGCIRELGDVQERLANVIEKYDIG